jgi:hypothetical protein
MDKFTRINHDGNKTLSKVRAGYMLGCRCMACRRLEDTLRDEATAEYNRIANLARSYLADGPKLSVEDAKLGVLYALLLAPVRASTAQYGKGEASSLIDEIITLRGEISQLRAARLTVNNRMK